MSIALDLFNFSNGLHFGNYTSQGQSFGSNDLLDLFTNTLAIPSAKQGELNTTINVSFGYNIYYKMQGYNPITQVYEDWHSMGEPLIDPPSGNALENVSIVYSWIDR